jgi:hypothetical protein
MQLHAAMSLPNYASMAAAGGPNHWIQVLSNLGSKQARKKNVGVLCIFWWIIWKERNKSNFGNSKKSAQHLTVMILEEVKMQLMVYNIP